MGCCQGCARWLIGIVSICVIIVALVCGLVIYLREKNKNWAALIENNIPFIFILITMSVAVVVSLIGFLLCCCKKKCLYVTYLILIIIVIGIEAGAIALAFCFQDRIIDGIEDNWLKSDHLEKRKKVEESFKCCNYRNATDDGNCGYTPAEGQLAENCYENIKDEINRHMGFLRIATIVMCVVEVVLFVCACYLVCSSKNDDEGVAKF